MVSLAWWCDGGIYDGVSSQVVLSHHKQASFVPQETPLTCDLHIFGGSCQHLSGHEVDLCIELGLHTALDTQHLTERVLITIANFKLLPCLPVGLSDLREEEGGGERTYIHTYIHIQYCHNISQEVLQSYSSSHCVIGEFSPIVAPTVL